MTERKPAFETLAIRTQAERSLHREHSVPIYATSSFVFDDAEQARALFADEQPGNIYTRFSNPNNDELIEKLCALEGTEDGLAVSSGMAAMFVSLASLLESGDHVVASRSLFGSTHQILTKLLPRWGIGHTYVDAAGGPAAFEAAITERTRMIFLETPSNPGLDVIDLEALGEIARRRNVWLNVDNCFATPYLQNPARYGADLVTHSATKLIDGQGRVIGGAVLGRRELIQKARFFARHTGPAMSPFHGWILSKSLETLAVRLDRHCESALAVASWLEAHPETRWVRYPFLPSHPQYTIAKKQMRHGGVVVSFELAGGRERATRLLDALALASLTANLGDTRTIVTHPASMTHSKLSEEERVAVGITPGLLRIAIGLEHVDDLRADLAQAIEKSR